MLFMNFQWVKNTQMVPKVCALCHFYPSSFNFVNLIIDCVSKARLNIFRDEIDKIDTLGNQVTTRDGSKGRRGAIAPQKLRKPLILY